MANNFDINNYLKDFLNDVSDFDINNMIDLRFSREELYCIMKSVFFVSNCFTLYLEENLSDVPNVSKLDSFLDLLDSSYSSMSAALDVNIF